MESFDDSFVYHGSPQEFDSTHANPKRNVRKKWNEDTQSFDVIFDQESFHATPYKWIALAYTYQPTPYAFDGKTARYNIGVSLYTNNNEVLVYGFNSLEESLAALYGKGGYLYHFNKSEFLYKEGLGDLEVIAESPTEPVTVEKVDDPVEEMKKLGVMFTFIDLALLENETYRNYY